jgi:hypothetical protein
MNGTDLIRPSKRVSVQRVSVVVTDVLVVRRSEFGWHCQIAGKQVFLSALQLEPGFAMPAEGTRGPIKLTAAAVDDLNLSRRHP